MVNIREYQIGDATKIHHLFSKYTHYKRDASFWVWINRLLAEEKSIIVVAEIEGEIIGHYAILPRICKIKDEIEFKCGLGIHAFIDPNYRNLVSIFSITSMAYKIAELKKYDFIYGFPNTNFRLIQEKIEHWKKISLFNAFVKPLTMPNSELLKFDWDIVDENDFEKYFIINELLEIQNLSGKISFSKSLSYFLNRYIKHPQKLYQSWLLRKEGETIGIIVTKKFVGEEVKIHIIDYIIHSDEHLSNLIDDFEKKFSKQATVSVLWPITKYFSYLLIQKGYTQVGFDTFFGIKILSKKALDNQSLLQDVNNWSICMGDSDAF
ncbi:MAG: GNAT family N-acetyltransferase [Prolixibacteraceae bacterium]|jgi:hypothetical protein|nr:GNAT family N-acetyltransferase [Prolixibacteraceae bacterium]